MLDMDFDATIARLEQITHFKAIKTRNGYMTICPAHDDVGPSLSVSKARRGGFALLHCFAGCRYQDVRAKVEAGVCVSPWTPEKAALYAEPKKLVSTYTYRSAIGEPLFRKLRFEPKSFAIQHLHRGRWRGGLNGVTPVLYNLPKVVAAKTVFIMEGEKAVDKLSEWGLTGTCSFDGASANNQEPKWLPELYNPYLEGKHIVILPDNDSPGRAHAAYIMATLPAVASKQVIELPGLEAKADFYDWAEVGYTIDELRKLWLTSNKD